MLQSLDLSILHLIRETLRNPFFDWLMPVLSGNILFAPAVVIFAVLLAWKGGVRGRLCLLMVAIVVFVGDTFICATLKDMIGRTRPGGFDVSTEYGWPDGTIHSHSMPSSHTANWFSAMTVAFIYYRKSWRFMLPLALAVGYSRIYKGAHYPTDVLAGAAVGMGYGFAIVWLLDAFWRNAGRRWFPLWWRRLPSILEPLRGEGDEAARSVVSERESVRRIPFANLSLAEQQWLRLGYVLVFALLFARLIYLASGRIELGIDEAYQWIWSKHLALSYYSKPPLIAFAQRLGTSLFGDTMFGVRFLSPVSAAIVGWLLLRFLARQGHVRAGFWLVLISAATPLLAVGATVLTVDCLLVLFWAAAMVSGWEAMQQNSIRGWLWTGLWIGLGCLSKYTALLQPLCWAIFFILSKPSRIHLRRPGPYLALGIALLCTLPIWIWNSQHGWITLTHVATNARVDRPWKPSISYFLDFAVSELGLLNPFFAIATVWAAIAVWRQFAGRAGVPPANPGVSPANVLYLLSMGAPLFLGYTLYTLHSRVLPNWIAASILPLFCLMVIYWETRYRAGLSAVRGWLATGLSLGLFAVILLHDTNLVSKLARRPLPPERDPLRQVRAWPETAQVVGTARTKLLAEGGRPVFIICGHYGMTGELSFYLPEAKAGVPDHPLVYFQSSDAPLNQFFFWPGYRERKGENAIFVLETDSPQSPPEGVRREFASIRDLGLTEILYRGRVFRRLQLFECRDLQ